MRLKAILMCAVFLGVACSGADSYGSMDEIIAAMSEGDVICTDLHVRPPAELTAEAATCSVDGVKVEMYGFEDSDQKDDWLKLGTLLGGEQIRGPNWVVRTESTEVADAIEDALKGERVEDPEE
jgi:hypothetical protein